MISGNAGNGVNISGGATWGNRVSGNRIGVNADGTAALSNSADGVHLEDSFANQIGGRGTLERNIISGNGGRGSVSSAPTHRGTSWKATRSGQRRRYGGDSQRGRRWRRRRRTTM